MVGNKKTRIKLLGGILSIFVIVAVGSYLLLLPKTEERVYHVGVLSGFDTLANIIDGFKVEMTELGYIEGKNIVYDIQGTNFEPDKEQQILRRFVDDNVDLIFTFPTEVALVAKTVTHGTGVPVVFSYSTIEGNNLIDSVRQPGENITGVREPGPDIFVKRLEILQAMAPQAKRVYITYNPNVPFIPPALDVLRNASSVMNVTLVETSVTTVEEIQADLQARNESVDIGMDAILIMGEPISVSPTALETMTKFAAEHKLPIGGLGTHSIAESIIFSYEIEFDDMGRLAAPLVDKVLRGIPAGTIPVTTPEAKLLINYKLAQDLNLTVSEGLLNLADEIVQ